MNTPSPSIFRRLAETCLVAALYYLSARIGYLMAIPPGVITPFWPPSGLALAAVLIWGPWMGIGIFAGSLFANLTVLPGAAPLSVACALAAGSTLQAWLGAWLINRFIKIIPADTIRATLFTIGITALATLIAPSVGVTSLYIARLVDWSGYVTEFWTWWLGDFIGILLFTPALVILSIRSRKQHIGEPLLWPITSLILGLTLLAFFLIWNSNQLQTAQTLERETSELSRGLQATLDKEFLALTSIRGLYTSSHEVTASEFKTFSAALLSESPATLAFEWIPRITQADRPAYEQSIRAQGYPAFSILEKDSTGASIPAGARPEYFPVTLIEPFTPNQAAFGYDLASNPFRLNAINAAIDSGKPAATAPIHLVQETSNQVGLLIILPVYSTSVIPNSLQERRANLRGLVLGVYQSGVLLQNAYLNLNYRDIETYLYDVSDPANPMFLGFSPSVSGPQTIPLEGAPSLADLQTGMFQTQIIKIAGRDWIIVVRPGRSDLTLTDEWAELLCLLTGLLLVRSFLTYVNSRKKLEAILASSEAEFRSLSDHALSGVIRINFDGQISYINQAAADSLGYDSPESVSRDNLRLHLKDVTKFEEMLQLFRTTDEIRNQELNIQTIKGEKRTVLYSTSVNKDLIIITFMDITERIQAAILQETVYKIAEAAQSAGSLQDLYAQIHRQIAAVMYAENFYIALYDETTKMLRFVYSVDEKDQWDSEPFALGNGLTEQVLRTGKSLQYDPNIRNEWLVRANYVPVGTVSQTWLGVPLIAHARTIGVMAVQHYFDASAFTRREQQILEFVSSQVATAIDRRQASELLEASQANLEAAQAIAHMGSWELDVKTGSGTWSTEMFRLFERNPSQGAPPLPEFMQSIHPNDQQPLLDAQQMAIDLGESITVVYRAISTPYEQRYYETRIQPLVDANGKLVNISGTVLDITKRRKVELELNERLMELTCLYNISLLLEDKSATLESTCQNIVGMVIPAMQQPSLSTALIELDGAQYHTSANLDFDPDIQPAIFNLQAPILINGATHGRLAIFYNQAEPVFIPEEQNLIDNVARMLGQWLERRQFETDLLASTERFRQLSDNLYEVFWMFDQLEQKMVYISPAYEIVWGRSCESIYLEPREYIRSILPEDQPGMFAALEKQSQGIRTELEYRIQRPDGTIRWVWDRSFPVLNQAGIVIRTAGIATDITEQKATQQELEAFNRDLEKRVEERTAEVRQSEETYRALFENANDGIFLFSPEGKEVQANQHGLNMIGYTHQEWLDVNQGQVVPINQLKDSDDQFQAALRGEHVPLYERTLVSKDEKNVQVEINLSAVRDPDGKPVLVQSVVRDITQRKKSEETLRENRDKLSSANAALEKAGRLKDEFLASMSHELRTPLTGILGLSEALQMQAHGALNDKQLKAIKNINVSGRHLLELINDILDLSKIEAGKLEMQIEPCSVADVCQASLQLVKGLAQQKKQNVSFAMNTPSITLRADGRRLKQMLVNLLSNAIKFTPEGGQIGLDIQTRPDENSIHFCVWDKGIGIKPEDMGKLFKPFIQIDSSLARQYSGTGLGLSLVQRMAELHGGSILVESDPDQGSRFTISLPWSKAEAQPGTPTNPGSPSPGNNAIIIEHNPNDAEQFTRFLLGIGISATIQPTARGALLKTALLAPGLILLNLNLPDESGMELLSQLRTDERTRAIPVIVITSSEKLRAEAVSLGAAGYLSKPFGLQELRAQFARAFSSDYAIPIPGKKTAPQVLIADDNEIILDSFSSFLESIGFDVSAARSGLELLKIAPEIKPDIILMDIQMPNMDGLETIRRLRNHADPQLAATPIIALTALAMTGDRELCIAAGANEYISKPVTMKHLANTINRLIHK